MADNQEFSKFTLTSKKDPASGSYRIASYDKDVRAFLNAVKSALPKDAFFSVGEKELSKQGKLKIDIYTHKEDAGLVRKALDERAGELYFKGSTDEKYNIVKRRTVTREEQKSLVKEETERTNKESEKTREKNHRGIVANFLKVLGSLTVLTDIARRILSTVMTNATESARTAMTAHNMGMSYRAVKEYEQIETKSGLELGTLSKAIADLQARFGNELSLDTEGLEYLGVILGSELGNLLVAQLQGGANEDALATILDRANAIVAEGKSPTGQYVGETEARVKMYNYLLRMFPELASIFAKQQEQMNNVNSIYYDTFSDFATWKDVMLKGTPAYTPAQQGLVQTLAEYKNVTEALVKKLKDNITITLAPALIAILSKIANLRIGLTEEENAELNYSNFLENQKTLTEYKRRLGSLPTSTEGMTEEQKLQYLATKDVYETYIEKIEKENEKFEKGKNVGQIKPTEHFIASQIAQRVGDVASYQAMFHAVSLPKLKSIAKKYFSTEEIAQAQEEVYGASDKEIDKEIKRRVKEKEKEREEKLAEIAHNIDPYNRRKINTKIANAIVKEQAEYLGAKISYDNMGKAHLYDIPSITEADIDRAQVEAEIEAENRTKISEEAFYSNLITRKPLAERELQGVDPARQKREAYSNEFFTASQINLAEAYTNALANKIGAGTYGLAGIKSKDGMYRIVLDINSNGRQEEREITLFEGLEFGGTEGLFNTTITIGNEGAKINYSNALQQSASEAR